MDHRVVWASVCACVIAGCGTDSGAGLGAAGSAGSGVGTSGTGAGNSATGGVSSGTGAASSGTGGKTGATGGAAQAGSSSGGSAGVSTTNPGDCSKDTPGTMTVCNQKIGTTLKYFGVTPGGYSDQNAGYLNELGVKWIRGWRTYRDGQTTPFDGHTIAEVKANPDVLDWTSVGRWVGNSGWLQWAAQNNAVYCPVVTWFRNLQTSTSCAGGVYAFDTTPGSADENRLWLGVFGMAYWANVKNSYNLTTVALINEPDNCSGNGGTENTVAGTNRIIQLGKDALTYVNKTLVSPAKDAIIAGPDVLSWYNGQSWVDGALRDAATADSIDRVSFHSYWGEHWWDEIHDGSAHVNGLTNSKKKIWIDEWGQWWYAGGYGDPVVVRGMSTVMPQLGLWNVELESPWQLTQSNNLNNGLVLQDGSKTGLYWITKMLGRALLSEKDMLKTSVVNTSTGTIYGWATRDTTDLYVIYYNLGTSAVSLTIDVGVIAAAEGKKVETWHVGPNTSSGEVTDPSTTVSGGVVKLSAAAGVYYVLKVDGAGSG